MQLNFILNYFASLLNMLSRNLDFLSQTVFQNLEAFSSVAGVEGRKGACCPTWRPC